MTVLSRWGATLAGLLNPVIQDTKPDTMTVIMAASRYSRRPSTVASFMRRVGYSNAVIAFTEMQDPARAKRLAMRGRQLFRYPGSPALSELACSVPNAYEAVAKHRTLSGKTYTRVGGATAPAKRMLTVYVEGIPIHILHTVAMGTNVTLPNTHRTDVFKADMNAVINAIENDRVGIVAADFNTMLTIPNAKREWLDSRMKAAGYRRANGNSGIVGFYVKGIKGEHVTNIAGGGFSDHGIKKMVFKP